MALMTETAHAGPERDHYLDLVRRFPLRPIRSDEGLAQAIAVIDSLIIRGDLDSGEQDYLDVLTDLVEKYEADEHPMAPVSDAVMLRHLMEARGITQSKLADDVGIAVSTISEALAGKRSLTRRHIRVLAKYFGVSPAVFPI
jgi:HTH-type transcriptional regulator / antitoxin HigA